ncbi:MAG: ABC transporter ATP-binding protein [Bacteroidetes bacterium]|nr:ABC transporter ATP-binding protein [Bacteroidota bacterium]
MDKEVLLKLNNMQIASGKRTLATVPRLWVRPGEIHGIIGESGSGKSLTLLSIAGLLAPGLTCTGEAVFHLGEINHSLYNTSEKIWRTLRGRHIGMVFQEPMTALNPQMTCGEQLMEAWCVHGSAQNAAEEINKALLQVGFTETERFLQSYPHQISGGQRQRIMIAMASLHKPALLLADEPTTALDTISASGVMDALVDTCTKMGSALILVSHDLETVAKYCRFITVMRRGEVVVSGTREEVLSENPHPYVRELLDANPTAKNHRVADSDAILKAEHLGKLYRHKGKLFEALKDVSFALSSGQTLALVGFSGSGKSTIARILTGLEDADTGMLYFNGARLKTGKPTGIQMVFQDPYASLNMELTNLYTVSEVFRVKGENHAAANAKAMALLGKVGLSREMANGYPHQLSGGQRQRLCIARALASEPRVLILDESVAALDPLVQKQILDLLKSLQAQTGMIYIFITHNLQVARALGDRFLVLDKGHIVHYGTELTGLPA